MSEATFIKFEVGEQVYIRDPHSTQGGSRTLLKNFIAQVGKGPFYVLKIRRERHRPPNDNAHPQRLTLGSSRKRVQRIRFGSSPEEDLSLVGSWLTPTRW